MDHEVSITPSILEVFGDMILYFLASWKYWKYGLCVEISHMRALEGKQLKMFKVQMYCRLSSEVRGS